MKTYIATGFGNWEAHNRLRDALAKHGITLTYDWTDEAKAASIPAFNPEVFETHARIKEIAIAEVNAVLAADFVIVLLPGARGTHVELGVALAAGLRRVFLLMQAPDLAEAPPVPFYYHPNVIRLSVEGATAEMQAEAIMQVLRKAREDARGDDGLGLWEWADDHDSDR
jgi:hypothetical protein